MAAAPLAVAAGEIVPQGAVAHETVQLTPLLLGSFATVAVKTWLLFASTSEFWGETETVTPKTVMVPEFETEGLTTDVAANVTVRPAKGVAEGAV